MKKLFAAAAAAAILLTGCSSGGEPASTVFSLDKPESVPQSVPSATNSSNSDNSANSGASLSSNSGISRQELENASKNIWLFGKKISLPCRFEEFGDDFSVGDEHSYQMKDDLIVFLYYKGEVIGEVVLENCTVEDPNKAAKKVVQLALGNAADNPVSTEGWHNEEIFFDVLGVTMRSKRGDVEELLGKPTRKRTDGKKERCVYRISDTNFIEFTFISGKIVEFVIEAR